MKFLGHRLKTLNATTCLLFNRPGSESWPHMDVLSPFIILCHSDWLFHGDSCLRLDVVHPLHAWSSSPVCHWHCSWYHLFLQATPLYSDDETINAIFICPMAIAYSYGTDNKIGLRPSVCLCVCLSVRVSSLSRSHFFVDFHQIWHRGVNPQK